jgi:formate-dependent nitrite reductase membrane component NrfD
MSIGSYILTAFGTASLVTAVGEALRRHPAAACAAHIAQLPAAAAGAGMLSYTGALLSSTSIPLWASESPLLAARFAASGMAAGAAALSIAEQIGGRPASAAPLNYLMLASNKAYALISHKAHQRHRAAGVAASLREGPYGPLYKLGGALIVALPAGLHLIALVAGRRWRVLPMISAVSVLAGVALTRHAYLQAGSASANGRTDNPG